MNLLGISFPELVMVGIIALAVLIPAWRIVGKAGFPPGSVC
jgi:flagellar biosynthesis protein FliR